MGGLVVKVFAEPSVSGVWVGAELGNMQSSLTISNLKSQHYFLNIIKAKACMFTNKPSFCSGSCDEIHARTKLQNKTKLKH